MASLEPARPIDNIDLSLIKHFTLKDRYRPNLEGVALNILNHPQFIPGSLNNTAPVNTFSAGQQSYITVSSPQFNRPDLAFSSNPRTLQIVLRFNW